MLILRVYFLCIAEEEAYHCLAGLVGSKEKVFINQTKLLHEVTWKTVMQIAKKHTVSEKIVSYLLINNRLWNYLNKFTSSIDVLYLP